MTEGAEACEVMGAVRESGGGIPMPPGRGGRGNGGLREGMG